MADKVSLSETFARFAEHWTPKIVGEVNNMHVKLVKFKGEFIWHHHDTEDELFLVVKGELLLRFRDKDVQLGPGEFIIVPHGVEHQPMTKDECHVILLEPVTTVNTGTVQNALTARDLERLA